MSTTTTASTPYNTRRKSLSLSELGITVPKRSRGVSHPSPPSDDLDIDGPPVKKPKRSHDAVASAPSGLMSPPRTTTIRFKDRQPNAPQELSPPPSPAAEGATNKVDVEGISDDIVVGTIQQLERTGNRPHLVKELGAVLATKLRCVEKSANPSALISSRLTAYLHRTWPNISPCPLAKDLSPVHPRRLYFFLTTMPRQPIPDVAQSLPTINPILTPSLSSASAADEEERYNRQRTALSPSPEVDLSSPELDDDNEQPAPGRPFSGRNSLTRESSMSSSIPQNRRAASPQLETEERDFKQTANALYEQAQQRRNSQSKDVNMTEADASAGAEQESSGITASIEGVDLGGEYAAADLFGQASHLKIPQAQLMDFSSPVIQPQHKTEMSMDSPMADDYREDDATAFDDELTLPGAAYAWDALQSPEDVEVAELDGLFDAY